MTCAPTLSDLVHDIVPVVVVASMSDAAVGPQSVVVPSSNVRVTLRMSPGAESPEPVINELSRTVARSTTFALDVDVNTSISPVYVASESSGATTMVNTVLAECEASSVTVTVTGYEAGVALVLPETVQVRLPGKTPVADVEATASDSPAARPDADADRFAPSVSPSVAEIVTVGESASLYWTEALPPSPR